MEEGNGERIFGNIGIGSRGGLNTGSLKLTNSSLIWRRSGGGRTIEVPTTDISGLQWMKIYKNCMLLVKRKNAPALNFIGFRDSDLESIKSSGIGDIDHVTQALQGRNWTKLAVDGPNLLVSDLENNPSFAIPLPDVAQVQQGKDEVLLQFPVDDVAIGDREDALVEIAFHVPKDCKDFAELQEAQGEGVVASKAFFELASSYTDIGAATGEAIVTFDSVAVVVPRGRFDVEMFASSLKLVGQAQDFRVQYDSILRIFVLPKVNTAQTLVAVCLDPPIRKGQTFYNTVLCQFHNDEEMSVNLDIPDDVLKVKNDKGAKLERTMTGPSPDTFARVLRGLSGAKLTRPGAFRDGSGEGVAVRCSYKADDGYLYPLERAFFYIQKPPLLMAYDDVDSVEFLRQSTGITAAKTFDLAVRMRGGQDHLFRGIPRSEWTNLFEWIQAKQLRIENFKEAQRGPGAGPMSYVEAGGLGGGIDQRMADEGSEDEEEEDEDEEDEDFDAVSESESSESSEDEDEDGPKIVPENDVAIQPKKKAKVAHDGAQGGGKEKQKKQRKKKDKDAPKKAMAAFMFYSNAVRNQVKEENPGIAFTEVGKKIGEMWKALSSEEKAPYEAQAEADKKRYAEEMEAYQKRKAGAGSMNDDGEEEEEEENKVKVEDNDDDNDEAF